MPRLTTETFGGGDQSWLGSAHGIANARTEVLDISEFPAATYYPNGYIPAGIRVAKVGGVLIPYDATEATTTGAGVLAGVLLTDQKVVGTADFAVPLLDHGRLRTAKLPAIPAAFVTPTAAAKRAATTFVYI